MSNETEEQVGKLEGDPAVDRVIVQDDVKLYRAKVVLAYLDSKVYDFGACSVFFSKNPVPVFSEDMKQIGSALVYVDNERIFADVTIDYASEERLMAETQSIKLWPWFFGAMKFAAMPLFDFHSPLVPTGLRVDGIQLMSLRPSDERLVPFGSMVI